MGGRAMAQPVIRQAVTEEARVHNLASPHEICGRQSGTGTGFPPSVLQFSSVSITPSMFHTHSFVHHRRHVAVVIDRVAKLYTLCCLYAKPRVGSGSCRFGLPFILPPTS